MITTKQEVEIKYNTSESLRNEKLKDENVLKYVADNCVDKIEKVYFHWDHPFVTLYFDYENKLFNDLMDNADKVTDVKVISDRIELTTWL